MEYEATSYNMDTNGEELATNFDDFIPQVFIKNVCKGRLIEPKFREQLHGSDLDNGYAPEFTPNPVKRINVKKERPAVDETHNEEKFYKCNFCNYESESKYKVRMHRKTHAGEDFACHLCTFKTTNKNELQQHVKGHLTEKVYRCAYCSFQTLYKTGLKTHLLRHTGVKPYKCEWCDYRAFQKIHVERHAVTHASGKQNYKCTSCDFKTAFKIRLERHSVTHEEELIKPEEQIVIKEKTTEEITSEQTITKCELCDYTTESESELFLHLETHEGEKL